MKCFLLKKIVKRIFIFLIFFPSLSFGENGKIDVESLKLALKILDDTISILKNAKSLPERDKALSQLAVVRIKLDEAIKNVSSDSSAFKQPSPQVIKTKVSGEGVEVESNIGPEGGKFVLKIGEEKQQVNPLPKAPLAISDKDFSDLLSALKKLSFGSERLNLLKEAAKRNYFLTEHVCAFIRILEFGSEKVEAAAILYPRTIDKKNFFKVYSELEFEGERKELQKRIEKWDKVGIPLDENEDIE